MAEFPNEDDLSHLAELSEDEYIRWAVEHPAEAQAAVELYHRIRVRLARRDPNEFIEYVAIDEETGQRFQQSPIHEKMQAAVSEHDRVVVFANVEAGKTSQLSVYRTLWELGRNPNLRIAVISNTVRQARKVASNIKHLIESSEALHDVFPGLRPGKQWSETFFTVERTVHSRDPSITVLSVDTEGTLGSRFDLVILDDVLSLKNTLTEEGRAKMEAWYKANIVGRLTRKARVVAVGTPWSPYDLYHGFEKSGGRWKVYRFPVIDPETGALNWPDRWTSERIKERSLELGPLETARQLYCQARDDEAARFKREWIEGCIARGEGRSMPRFLDSLPSGYKAFTGVDLGTRDTKSSDLTVLFTICLHPSGDAEVLNIESGRWTSPDIMARIMDVHTRYKSMVLIEDTSAQDYIRQNLARQTAVPVFPFHTDHRKRDPIYGVEGLAVQMFNRKWIIPSNGGRCAPEVERWIEEMLFYNPEAHTGDRLMASWFAREGARRFSRTVKGTSGSIHRR